MNNGENTMDEKRKVYYDGLFKELSDRRGKLKSISDRTETVIDEIEKRVLTYIVNSKNLPSVDYLANVLDSLSNLYRINQDVNEKLIRSFEKTIELDSKYMPDEEGNTGQQITQKELMEAFKLAAKAKLADETQAEELEIKERHISSCLASYKTEDMTTPFTEDITVINEKA